MNTNILLLQYLHFLTDLTFNNDNSDVERKTAITAIEKSFDQ